MNPCHFHPSTPSGDLLFFGGVLDQERGRYHLARCQTQDQWGTVSQAYDLWCKCVPAKGS